MNQLDEDLQKALENNRQKESLNEEDDDNTVISTKAKNKIHELEHQLSEMIRDNQSLSNRIDQLQTEEATFQQRAESYQQQLLQQQEIIEN